MRPPPLGFYLYSSADTNASAQLRSGCSSSKHLVGVHIWGFFLLFVFFFCLTLAAGIRFAQPAASR